MKKTEQAEPISTLPLKQETVKWKNQPHEMTQHFVFESVPGYSPIHDDRERIKEPVAAGKSQRNERKVWTMKLNKEKFLKSELGGNLQECVTAWDHWLTELRKFNIDTVGQKYRETRKAADWCQAQWEVFQTVMRQFYNIEYHFSRTDEYFGVCTEDETDWLFKVEREV